MDIKKNAYEKYKLRWMIDHGYTLADLMVAMQPIYENYEIINIDLYSLFIDWESDAGFNGSIWACYEEFLQNEFLDDDYMRSLLLPEEWMDYLDEMEASDEEAKMTFLNKLKENKNA